MYRFVISAVQIWTVSDAIKRVTKHNKILQYKGEIIMAKIAVNMSVKDIFNAKRASTPVEAIIGQEITVKGFALSESIDENGEAKEVGYVVDNDGNVFGFVSDICRQGIADLAMLYEEDNNIMNDLKVTFKKGLSKSGREFYYMHIA